jgi:hypothetical protein
MRGEKLLTPPIRRRSFQRSGRHCRLVRSSTASGRNAADSPRDSGQISFELLGTYGSVRRPAPGAAWAPAPVGKATSRLPIEIPRSLGRGWPTPRAESRSCAPENLPWFGESASFPEPRRKVSRAESDHVASALHLRITEEATQGLDSRLRPVGAIGQGALAGLRALAPALAEEDGGRAVAVGDGFDVQGTYCSYRTSNMNF